MSNYDSATLSGLDFNKADISACDAEADAVATLEATAAKPPTPAAQLIDRLQALADVAAAERQNAPAPSPAFSRTTDNGASPMRPSVTRKVPPSPAADSSDTVQRWLKKSKDMAPLPPDHPTISTSDRPAPAQGRNKPSRPRAGTRASMLPRPAVPLVAGRDVFGLADPNDWPTPAEMSDGARSTTSKARSTGQGALYSLPPPPAGTVAAHRKAASVAATPSTAQPSHSTLHFPRTLPATVATTAPFRPPSRTTSHRDVVDVDAWAASHADAPSHPPGLPMVQIKQEPADNDTWMDLQRTPQTSPAPELPPIAPSAQPQRADSPSPPRAPPGQLFRTVADLDDPPFSSPAGQAGAAHDGADDMDLDGPAPPAPQQLQDLLQPDSDDEDDLHTGLGDDGSQTMTEAARQRAALIAPEFRFSTVPLDAAPVCREPTDGMRSGQHWQYVDASDKAHWDRYARSNP
ncbi:hypothetical protein AURDEDRAFT_126917, partial [Auricularia subglabra TFB-10046 SS5]